MKASIKRRILVVLFSITLVVLFVLIYFVPSVSDVFTQTVLAQYDKVQITDDTVGYIVRDEVVYFASRDGIVENLMPEGEKAKRGTKVVRFTPFVVESNDEMDSIKEKINRFAGGDNIFTNDIARIDTAIATANEQLKSAKRRGNEDEQREVEDRLARLEAKRSLIAQAQEHLTEKQEGEEANQTSDPALIMEGSEYTTISSTAKKKFAEDATDIVGVVSYFIDGFETEFTPANMYILNREKVEQQEFKTVSTYQSALRKGDPVFKLMKDSTWFILSWIDEEDVVKYKKGNIVRVTFAEHEITGKIDDIIESSGNILVIMKFTTYFPEVVQLRKIDMHVVTLDTEGLKIPNKSLADNDGVIGVYVKDLNGGFAFKPVKIMKTDGQSSLVYAGTFDEEVTDGAIQKVETIKAYDEILKNGEDGKK